jgi:hypothetical protein
VQEKLDGSCVAVAMIDGIITPLGRSGWSAISSPYLQHRFFHNWVMQQPERFTWLKNGERIVGEWLALAHGTRYELKHEPFAPFDIMRGHVRYLYDDFLEHIAIGKFTPPHLLHSGASFAIEDALTIAKRDNFHGAIDEIEGVVYRVERKGKVDFLAKYVQPDKIDGKYFINEENNIETWNWKP